jgi:hypothetical protein
MTTTNKIKFLKGCKEDYLNQLDACPDCELDKSQGLIECIEDCDKQIDELQSKIKD